MASKPSQWQEGAVRALAEAGQRKDHDSPKRPEVVYELNPAMRVLLIEARRAMLVMCAAIEKVVRAPEEVHSQSRGGSRSA